ncbi:NrdR family transcriptional regulator [Bremerella sp. P1]|uniref:NrdR family transcriptional regulator n=1 Tax=Bremerella sp. P1 TaxID=3026424 RepID=UPI003FCCC39E
MNHKDPPEQPRGIECPQCGCRHFYTTHTEPLRDGRIRRRKSCRHCGRRIVTYESPQGISKAADR